MVAVRDKRIHKGALIKNIVQCSRKFKIYYLRHLYCRINYWCGYCIQVLGMILLIIIYNFLPFFFFIIVSGVKSKGTCLTDFVMKRFALHSPNYWDAVASEIQEILHPSFNCTNTGRRYQETFNFLFASP